MIIYVIGTILSSLLLGIANYYHNNKKNKIIEITLIILSILPLSVISGLRKGLGTDYYYTYFHSFYGIMAGKRHFSREPLFYYLNKFIQLFSTNAQWIFVFTSFIFTTFLVLSTLRMSKNWAISILIILLGNYYFVSLNNVRQACAMSIATYAFSFACDRKYIRTIIFASLSIGFHSSAIILIPIYIICGIKNIEKYCYIIILILLGFTPLYIPLINQITNLVGYNAYFEEYNSLPLLEYIGIYGFLFLLTILYYKKLQTMNKYTFGLLLVFTFAVIFSILSVNLTLESTLRMTYWFSWPLIFIIPSFIKINENKIISYTFTVLILVVTSFLMIKCSYINGWNEVFPYIDIWGHVFS